MCRRDTTDLLVRLFLDRYNLNLLPVPREGSDCGDLYVRDSRGIQPPVRIETVFDGGLALPVIDRDEELAALRGVLSEARSASVGLGLLEGFLTAIGAAGVISAVQGSYERAAATELQFEFGDVTRDSLDPGALGRALDGRRLDERNALVRSGRRYYVVTAVVRTPSITLHSTREGSSGGGPEIEAAALASVRTRLTITRQTKDAVTYTGTKALAIGVELLELSYDDRAREFRLETPRGALGLSRAEPEDFAPAFVGPDGDIFLREAKG
jgi:hypothetical protein